MRYERREAAAGGFTLLEVLVALGILTVGSTCIVALFSAAMETYRRSELEFIATNVGTEVLDTAEDMLAHGASPATLDAAVKKHVRAPGKFLYTVTAAEEPNGAFRISATVRVESRGKGRTWVWSRTVRRRAEMKILQLPKIAPKRYG